MTKMIIAYEYPFTMVEHAWFNILCKTLNPNFVKISKTNIRNECMKVYDVERHKLKKIFKTIDQISLTCDVGHLNKQLDNGSNCTFQLKIIKIYN